MNFSMVRQALGQMDGQYQLKIAMFGVVVPPQIGEIEYNKKTGKPYQQVKIQDDTGETNKVKILGGKMTIDLIGKRLAFDIAPSPYQPDPSRPPIMYYTGFWNDRATVPSTKPPEITPVASQAASKPLAFNPNRPSLGIHTTAQQSPQVDWDAKDLRNAKLGALKAAVALQVAMAEIDKNLTRLTPHYIKGEADGYVAWIYDKPETELEKEVGELLSKPADEPTSQESDRDEFDDYLARP
jgi:hypothetical protein